MSSFKTVLIENAMIADITDVESFGVKSGPAQSTYQQFSAVSISNSAISWNIQIPSENLVLSRSLYLRATINATLKCNGPVGSGSTAGAGVPVDSPVIVWGVSEAWQNFPLNSLLLTTQCTINNTSVSTNTQDVLPMLLRMNDNRVLNRYNSMTPSYPDCAYENYADGLYATNNPLASYNTNSYDADFMPRGAFPTVIGVIHSVVETEGGPVVSTDASLISTSIYDFWVITIQCTVTEPFLALSPWTNCLPNMGAGLMGVNNLSFILNLDSTCKRLISTAQSNFNSETLVLTPSYITSIALGTTAIPTGIQNAQLLFNFLSLQDTQYAKLSTRNIVPYMEYPRYLSNSTQNVAVNGYASSALTSQSIQLNQIPELILICARVPMSSQTIANSSSFLTIKGIRITFNNASGLLATATQQDLYNMSAKNGSAQSFYEFGGQAYTNNTLAGSVGQIPTTGSLLVLDPSYDFSLPSYLSASSLGQYQFQFNLDIYNQGPNAVVPEICIITLNGGIFCTQSGTSQIFTGLLTKEMVLSTKEQNPVPQLDQSEYENLVGGKLSNRGMGGIHGLSRHLKKKLGGVSSGGVVSGGIASGGRSRLSRHLA